MSYDIDLLGPSESVKCECECGNEHYKPARRECYSANMTSNVACMWRAAGLDLGLWCYDGPLAGSRAAELVAHLDIAIANMTRDPATYIAMEPANKWGSYRGALWFLKGLRGACLEYPNAQVHGSN